MPTYLYRADQCPPLQVAAAQLDPDDPAIDPVSARKIIPNTFGPGSTSGPVNANAKLLDETGKYGAGAVAALLGLDLVAGTGSQVLVTSGILGGFGAPTEVLASIPVAVVNGREHIFLSRHGDPAVKLDPDLTVPGVLYGYLGSAIVAGGVPTSFDYSGRPEFIDGVYRRRTADVGPPLDALSGRVRIWTETQTGVYLWNGTAHLLMAQLLATLTAAAEVANARQVTVQAEPYDLLRILISDADNGVEAAAAPDGGVTIDVGTNVQTVTANKHYFVIADAVGQVKLTLTESTAKTFWVQAFRGALKRSISVAFV